jgi:spore maturation protein CgeB
LYITTDNPDLRVLYEVGDEIVVYDSVADAVEKITALLKDKQEIVRISRAGRLRAAEQHTWEKRFLRVLRAVL